MTQSSLFDAPAPAAQTTSREGIAVGDLIAWTSAGDRRVGRLVYAGPRIGFYAMSEFWRNAWEHEQFLKNPRLLRGSSDSWLHSPGQFMIARTQRGWFPIGDGVHVEKAGSS